MRAKSWIGLDSPRFSSLPLPLRRDQRKAASTWRKLQGAYTGPAWPRRGRGRTSTGTHNLGPTLLGHWKACRPPKRGVLVREMPRNPHFSRRRQQQQAHLSPVHGTLQCLFPPRIAALSQERVGRADPLGCAAEAGVGYPPTVLQTPVRIPYRYHRARKTRKVDLQILQVQQAGDPPPPAEKRLSKAAGLIMGLGHHHCHQQRCRTIDPHRISLADGGRRHIAETSDPPCRVAREACMGWPRAQARRGEERRGVERRYYTYTYSVQRTVLAAAFSSRDSRTSDQKSH
ncbi:hypothetical protein ON010_g17271 [Phytophthora cinnamomi]|nr:hypothetical protein ON010_g17271 [Phytophthora cinnamomi]